MPIPAMIAAAGSLASTGLQYFLNKKATENNRAYNTPRAQVERMRNAGMNPAMMFGDASLESYEGDQMQPPNVSEGMGAAVQAMSLAYQRQQIKESQAREDKIRADKELAESQNKQIQQQTDFFQAAWQSNLDAIDLQNQATKQGINIGQEQVKNLVESRKNMEVQRDNLRKDGKLKDYQSKEFEEKLKVLPSMLQEELRKAGYDADVSLETINQVKNLAHLYYSEASNQEVQKQIADVTLAIAEETKQSEIDLVKNKKYESNYDVVNAYNRSQVSSYEQYKTKRMMEQRHNITGLDGPFFDWVDRKIEDQFTFVDNIASSLVGALGSILK